MCPGQTTIRGTWDTPDRNIGAANTSHVQELGWPIDVNEYGILRLVMRRSALLGWAFLVVTSVLSAACGGTTPDDSRDDELGASPTRTEISSEAPVETVTAPPPLPPTVAEIDDPWLRLAGVSEWTGDLEGLLERGFIRLLTPADRTNYFIDGARERGIAVETANALEAVLAQRLGDPDAVRVVIIPVRREQLFPLLTRGVGDIAIGNLTITRERETLVDFLPPVVTNVRELVVTGPGAEPVDRLEDLAGREIWVRRVTSYFERPDRDQRPTGVGGTGPDRGSCRRPKSQGRRHPGDGQRRALSGNRRR